MSALAPTPVGTCAACNGTVVLSVLAGASCPCGKIKIPAPFVWPGMAR
jgi:hypothetical protein